MHHQEPRITVDGLVGAQETLLIPLWARAVEASRPEPILRDAKAVEILASLDYDFRKFAGGSGSQAGCCLRAVVIDGWVRRFLQEHPAGTVVEIGAGLDTRFERVDNGRVRWFDLDLPEAMHVRRRFFEETPRRRFLTCSVLEPDWIPTVQGASPGPVAFTAEGVLYYLVQSQVQQLFSMLADHFPGCLVAFDSYTPAAMRYANLCDPVGRTSGRLAWAIRSPQVIESWDPRYRLEESVALWDSPEHGRRYRDRLPRLLRAIHWALPFTRRMYRLNLVRLGRM